MGESPLKWLTGPIRQRQQEHEFLTLKREFSLLAEQAADTASDRLAVKEEYGSIVQQVAKQAMERQELKDTKTEIITQVADIFAERTTELQTLFHLLKGNIGAGCLSLPWSFSQLGIPLGVMTTFFIAFWTHYNCMTLLEVKHKNTAHHRTITYSDLGEVAYGRHFRTIVTGSIVVLQMAVCTVYLSFVGGNSLAFFQDYSPDLPFLGQSDVWSIIAVTPVVIAITLMPNLKALGPISEIAMLVLFVAFALLAVVLAHNLPNHDDMDDHPGPTRIPPTFDWQQAPLAVCGILYAFESICIVLPLEASMKDRSSFSTLFSWTYLGVAILYATMGVACVSVLGKVQDLSITAYLMEHVDDYNGYLLVTIANSLASIALVFTYALTMFPCIELWCQAKERRDRGDTLEPLEEDEEDWWGRELAYGPYDTPLLRLSLVFATVIMAIAIPNVTELIGLAGAIAGASAALIVPPMLALHFTDEDYPGYYLRKVQEYFLLGLGVLFGAVGAVALLYDIYDMRP